MKIIAMILVVSNFAIAGELATSALNGTYSVSGFCRIHSVRHSLGEQVQITIVEQPLLAAQFQFANDSFLVTLEERVIYESETPVAQVRRTSTDNSIKIQKIGLLTDGMTTWAFHKDSNGDLTYIVDDLFGRSYCALTPKK